MRRARRISDKTINKNLIAEETQFLTLLAQLLIEVITLSPGEANNVKNPKKTQFMIIQNPVKII